MTDALNILRDPYLQVTYLFVTGVAAIYCLIGLWAATSRRHWFLRAIIPCLALAALIPIRAHEPLIFYALCMAEIVAAHSLWRWWRRNVGQVSNLSHENADSGQVENLSYGRFHFAIRDLLLVMVVISIIAWTIAGFAGYGLLLEWPGAIVASLLLAGLTVAAWMVVTSGRPVAYASCLAGILAVAVAVEVVLLRDWMKIAPTLNLFDNSAFWRHDVTLSLFLYSEFATLLLYGMLLTQAANGPAHKTLRSMTARAVIVATWIGAAVPLATLYWRMVREPELPPTLTLAENVFPQLLERGEVMEKSGPMRARAIYQELLPLFDRPGYVPLEVSLSLANPFEQDRYWQRTRSICRAIDAEATILQNAGKVDSAAAHSLSILKVSQMLSRGGVTLDVMVGNAVEGVGLHRLTRLRTDLTSEMRAKVLDQLHVMEANQESIEVIEKRDAAYYCRTMRWRHFLERGIPFRLFGLEEDREEAFGHRRLMLRFLASRRLLLTDLAIRLFDDDHGQLPRTLDELVPQYLASVPIDPYADKPLVYRPDDDNFTLYSLGPDGIDNGGIPKPKGQTIMTPGIDWDLDSLIAP